MTAVTWSSNYEAAPGKRAAGNDCSRATIAICTATGNQGVEVVNRLRELNEQQSSSKKFRIIALTRNTESKAAAKLAQIPNVQVAQTDYTPGGIRVVLSSNKVDALFLNYVIHPKEALIGAGIIDGAIRSGVNHVVYSSTVACHTNTNVPHWDCSFETECYLRKAAKGADRVFRYHIVRLGHFNENFAPDSTYFAPKDGRLEYLWDPDATFPTASLRDAARVVGKLFAEPDSLSSGDCIDAMTEWTTARRIASAISAAKGETIEAARGPWFFLTFGRFFGWVPNTLLCMARYIGGSRRNPDWTFDPDKMPSFLGDKLLEEEPLETVEKFALRHYGTIREGQDS